jgi:hypothetical protein
MENGSVKTLKVILDMRGYDKNRKSHVLIFFKERQRFKEITLLFCANF